MHYYLTSSSQIGKLSTYPGILQEGNSGESVPQKAIPQLPSISRTITQCNGLLTLDTSFRASPDNPSNPDAVESF